MQTFLADAYELVCEASDLADVSTICCLDKSIHAICQRHAKKRRDCFSKYQPLLKKMAERVKKHVFLGLESALMDLLLSRSLYMRDVVMLWEMANGANEDARRCKMAEYVDDLGVTHTWTASKVVDALTNRPIPAYWNGFAYLLPIYFRSRFLACLPRCADGDFYSWSFANGIGAVGYFNHAPPLEAYLKKTQESAKQAVEHGYA